MSTLIRWIKFNLVGAVGMAVQLASLALFNRCFVGHYLLASAAALELTLLHNFVAHLHYTWRDRRRSSALLAQLLRFHLSNGLVSMLGNLALMRLLVGAAHLPLLVSNLIAILCCSILNFCLGHHWAFAATTPILLNRQYRLPAASRAEKHHPAPCNQQLCSCSCSSQRRDLTASP